MPFEEPKQEDLLPLLHGPDLVEEDRPALGRFEDPELVPVLDAVARSDPHPDPRQMARDVIADLLR